MPPRLQKVLSVGASVAELFSPRRDSPRRQTPHLTINADPFPRDSTKEDLQILKERLYALERQNLAQLTAQQERLDRYEQRLGDVESRLLAYVDVAIGYSNNERRSIENAGWAALSDRVQKLEDHLSPRPVAETIKGSNTIHQDKQANLDMEDHLGERPVAATINGSNTIHQDKQAHLDMEDHLGERPVAETINSSNAIHQNKQAPPDMMLLVQELREHQLHHHASLETLQRQSEEFKNQHSEHLDSVSDLVERIATVERHVEEAMLMTPKGIGVRTLTLGTPERLQIAKHCQQDPAYVLHDSIWDVLIFLHTPVLGRSTVPLLAFLNVFLQVAFIMVLRVNLESDIDDATVSAAQFFRMHFSHEERYADPFHHNSLAQRLCNSHYLQLEIGSNQAEVLDSMRQFIRMDPDGSWFERNFNGQTAAILVLICWTASTLRELHLILDLASAVGQLPRSPDDEETDISVKIKEEDGRVTTTIKFEKIHWMRVTFIFLTLMFKLAIAAHLFYSGAWWLATTVNVTELLLNAVALEFILQLDEILYEALCPSHARALISNCEPLTRKGRTVLGKCCDRIEARVVAFFLWVPLAVSIFYLWKTQPMVDNMKATIAAFCDPPLDFVYGTDALDFVHVSKPQHYDSKLKHLALKEALASNGTYANMLHSFNPTIEWSTTVPKVVRMSVHELADRYNPLCLDVLSMVVPTDTLYIAMQQTFGATTCFDLKDSCWNFSSPLGNTIRTLCSVTCGCHKPDSDLPVAPAVNGCPSACASTSEWSKVRRKASCMNPTISQLNQTSYWPQWINFLRATKNYTADVGFALTMYGCDFENHLSRNPFEVKQQLCSGTTSVGLKSISIACPETCNCSEADNFLCPTGPDHDWCTCRQSLYNLPPQRSTQIPGLCRTPLCRASEKDDLAAQVEHYLGSAARYAFDWSGLVSDCAALS